LALISGSNFFGIAATFPIKKVCTEPGTLQIDAELAGGGYGADSADAAAAAH
jgi:hypothetical protein